MRWLSSLSCSYITLHYLDMISIVYLWPVYLKHTKLISFLLTFPGIFTLLHLVLVLFFFFFVSSLRSLLLPMFWHTISTRHVWAVLRCNIIVLQRILSDFRGFVPKISAGYHERIKNVTKRRWSHTHTHTWAYTHTHSVISLCAAA